jgi:putative ABC transport system ATP-binding protein
LAGCGLEIRGLAKTYNENGDRVPALRDIDLDIAAGEFVVIIGANASGKTTLLRLIAGDVPASAGSICMIHGTTKVLWDGMPAWRRSASLGRVHQNPVAGTVNSLTVLENLRLAAMQGRIPSPLRLGVTLDEREKFEARLERLGLKDKLGQRVSELSHGQRQLLAVEMAMMRNPYLLLLDEHTASLDRANSLKCLELTRRLSESSGTTVLMVTHNFNDALAMGDKLVILREGRVAANLDRQRKASLSILDLFALCGLDGGRSSSTASGENVVRS